MRGVQRVYPAMGIVTNDMAQIRRYLATNHAPSDYVLTAGLKRLPATGAGVLTWQSQPVSMVCLDSTDQGTLFLFVTVAGSLYHGIYRFQSTLTETGLARAKRALEVVGYLIISVGILATAIYLLQYNPGFFSLP